MQQFYQERFNTLYIHGSEKELHSIIRLTPALEEARVPLRNHVKVVDLVADDGEAKVQHGDVVLPTNTSRFQCLIIETVVHRFACPSNSQQFIKQRIHCPAIRARIDGEQLLFERRWRRLIPTRERERAIRYDSVECYRQGPATVPRQGLNQYSGPNTRASG